MASATFQPSVSRPTTTSSLPLSNDYLNIGLLCAAEKIEWNSLFSMRRLIRIVERSWVMKFRTGFMIMH